MSHQSSVDDRAFRCAFEACAVAPPDFGHDAHVRLAYVYLCEGSVDEAVSRMKSSLRRFLAHVGAPPSKYHETITRAWVMAVRHFMEQSDDCRSADAFMHRHPQLLDPKIMLSHYSASLLFSQRARSAFVEPDIQAIPQYA